MSGADTKVIHPSRRIRGRVTVPGDKSVSHRVALLSALASGESTVDGFLDSEDCLNTLKAVEALGASISRNGDHVTIRGTGGLFRKPSSVLDMGNSGTGIRLLAGLLAGQGFSAELTGDASLRSRPMRRIQEPLARMGATVELLGDKGCAPVRITGGKLKGIDYVLPVASAQVKSCVLFAGLFAEGRTVVTEPEPTRDHTERMLRAMGMTVEITGLRISVEGSGGKGLNLRPGKWTVPGDFSSAAFWLVAAACREGAEVTIEGVGLNPRRTALLDVLRRMGADIEIGIQKSESRSQKMKEQYGRWEEVGTVTVKGRKLKGTEIGGVEIPNLIDEIPILAVAGALAEGRTVIRDAQELRVKESDRISTMARGLTTVGVQLEEKPDGMIVTGASKISGGMDIDSFDDHRVAMAMSVLALSADAPVGIMKTACVATSYPTFWKHLTTLTGQHVE